jgi:cytochrome c-type biogenesis protein CcmH/NrfF
MSPLRLSWLLMAVVLLGALVIGTRGDSGPQTDDDRARSIALTIKCPTCRSQSAAESDAPAAKFIREEIARRIEAGESDDQIRGYFASRYGQEILLTPASSGVASLVWVLPVAAGIIATAGLAVAFRRWKRWA